MNMINLKAFHTSLQLPILQLTTKRVGLLPLQSLQLKKNPGIKPNQNNRVQQRECLDFLVAQEDSVQAQAL